MKVKLKEVAQVVVSLPQLAGENEIIAKWFKSSDFLINNEVQQAEIDDKFKVNDIFNVRVGDIVIKRIAPTYINVIDEEYLDTYYGANIVIIRSDINKVENGYLACVLNWQISRLTTATALPSINKKELDELVIDLPPLETQVKIAKLWRLIQEKNRLYLKLMELSKLKEKYIFSKVMKVGEKTNG